MTDIEIILVIVIVIVIWVIIIEVWRMQRTLKEMKATLDRLLGRDDARF